MLMMRRTSPRGVQHANCDEPIFGILLSFIRGREMLSWKHVASAGKVKAALGQGFVPFDTVKL
jgi:hypothetical protein